MEKKIQAADEREIEVKQDSMDDLLAGVLARISSIQSYAIPKHRFYLTVSKSEALAGNGIDLSYRAKEIWSTLFPNGLCQDVTPPFSADQFPLLWASKKDTTLKIIKGQLADGSYSAEDADGSSSVVSLALLGEGTFLNFKPSIDQKVMTSNKTTSARDWFIYAIKKRKQPFIEAVVASFVISILALALSFYSMQVYDRVVPTQSYSTLYVLTIGVFLAIVFEFISKEVRSDILDRACKNIDTELSGVFFGRMLSIRMDARPNSVGTFAAQIKQFELVRNFMTSSTLFVFADIPFVFFFMVVIWMIGGSLVWVPIILLPISILTGFFAKWKLGSLAEDQLLESNQKNGLLVEAIDGIESIKAVGGEWKMLEYWKLLTAKSADKELKIRSVTSMATSLTQSVQQLSYILMIAFGAYAISTGKITMGGLMACSIISNRALSPIAQIASKIIQWYHAKAALKGLDSMMMLEIDHLESGRMVVPENFIGRVKLDKVSFSYGKGSNPAVNEVNLTINPSERIAIIGAVGSGKSTLIKILTGLYKPTSGKVFVDDVDMTHIAPEFLRESIGYLTQDVRLFNGSLRYNLTLGLPTPKDSKIIEACTQTGLIHIIKNHPKGLELPIFEGGRGLSGGQKQLVGLTRMLIAKPKLLILDEPTASMDGDLELKVMKTLFKEADPYSLVILSTHKLALLNFVNRIIVMDKGKVMLDGPRNEVIEKLKQSSMQAQQYAKKAHALNQDGPEAADPPP